jgi:small subunit ribosomal protein S6
MVKKYEMVILIDPQIGDSQVETTIQGYKQRLEEAGAEVLHVDQWGLRKLAYSSPALQGRQQAFYTLFQFSGDPALIQPLEAVMKLDESVLRYLFISVDGEFLRVPQLAPENIYIFNPPERPRDRRGPRRDRDEGRDEGREGRSDRPPASHDNGDSDAEPVAAVATATDDAGGDGESEE